MNQDTTTELISFSLNIEEDGWPPISVEVLHGKLLGPNRAKIENTPFFIEGISLDDVVEVVRHKETGKFKFKNLLEPCGNKALSIILSNWDMKNEVTEFLRSHNCFVEFGEFGVTKMLAVGIFPNTDYSIISKYLDQKEKNGSISYAELCIY